jgi:hypothetical protein
MNGLHEGDVAPAPSRCRRGYNSPVVTLYFTNPKLPASPRDLLATLSWRHRWTLDLTHQENKAVPCVADAGGEQQRHRAGEHFEAPRY